MQHSSNHGKYIYCVQNLARAHRHHRLHATIHPKYFGTMLIIHHHAGRMFRHECRFFRLLSAGIVRVSLPGRLCVVGSR
ncbi:hypothetical protein V5799_012865 [Amblyomma americanum]|uniref:Uncharacterized protein n=1 Tax=Amblyomma americanum TaxID=6943 RepID=A0AAQ4E7M5_AMBAM